jgi:hypothetical protein
VPAADILRDAVVYTDGSCYKAGHHTAHRAGWGLAALDEHGNLLASVWGRVGARLPQTNPAAEYVAGLAAAILGAAEVRTDFSGLARLGNKSATEAAHRLAFHGGLKLLILGRSSPSCRFLKVAAHVDPDGLEEGSEEWIRAVGNQEADRAAKRGASLQPPWADSEQEYYDMQVQIVDKYFRYAAAALAHWPSISPPVEIARS